MNRYTNISTSAYSPMSLNELMMAPAYKRQQHDATSEAIAETEAALAQVNPLAVHSDVAKKEQERLYNKLTQQSEMLNEKGFNSRTKGDFLKTYKDYQQTVGPMGTLGKINAAKTAYDIERVNALKTATAQGFSPEEAAYQWSIHSGKYEAGFDGTNIDNIDGLYAPEYIDVLQTARDYYTAAGGDSNQWSRLSSEIIYDKELGSYVLSDKTAGSNSNNKVALQAVADYMSNQVNNPRSTVGKSIAFQNKTPDDVLSELKGLNKIYEKTATSSERAKQISNFTPVKQGDELTESGAGLVVAGQQYAPARFTGLTYADLNNTISDMEKLENKTNEDIVALTEMIEFRESLDAELNDNPEYVELSNAYKKDRENYDRVLDEEYALTDNEKASILNRNPELNNISATLQREAALKQTYLNELKGQMDSHQRMLSSIVTPKMAQHKMMTTEYAIVPKTTKQIAEAKALNDGFDNLLHINPQSLKELGDITQIIDPNGSAKGISTDTDKLGLANLIFNSKPGSVTVMSHVARGKSGRPEIVFRVETEKGNAYDLDNDMGSTDYSGDIGDGKAVVIRLAFDTSKGEVGINNILGHVQDYVASTGPKAAELIESQRLNQVISKYKGRPWADAMNSKATLIDPIISPLYREMLIEQGITGESTDEEARIAKENISKMIMFK